MSVYQELTDEQWSRLKFFIPYGFTGQRGRNSNNRCFINALICVARSGGRWRDAGCVMVLMKRSRGVIMLG